MIDCHDYSLTIMPSPSPLAIYPVEYEGVKAVSFGFAGQGSALMQGRWCQA